jgi:hypothetical protein
MRKVAFILVFFIAVSDLFSQDPSVKKPSFPRYNVGVGAGMDYGGFGGRFTILTCKRLEFFGALGYNLLELGLNAGAAYRILPQSRICPYFGAMYGYNAVIKVTGADMYNQTYYGPTWNIGLEFWPKGSPGFLNLELLVPIRSSEYTNDLKSLKSNPNITFKNEPVPIGISIGYHFMF